MTTSHGPAAPFALARYREGAEVRLGLVAGDRIRPLDADALGAPTLNDFLAAPDWDRLAALAAEADDSWLPLAEVVLTAPVEPRQVLQAGANYREHVIELVAAGLTNNTDRTPEEARAFAANLMDERKKNGEPYFFIGLPAAVVGDDVPLVLPSYSDVHDWELELAIVIGREAFRVSREDAMDHVAGYTIVNDITTRDLVFRKDMKEIGTDWYRSKNAPGFLPTGPFLVPAAHVDGGHLAVALDLNGDRMQNGNTDDLLFDIPALISAASQNMPLLPGDLLLTGSPPGNGQHWKRFLRDGDVMTGSIEGLGTQIVRCVAEDAS
ncbi:fumarylacetoacetate hydrolase family protein [Microbacterium thalassium]|uniref:2-keto-4-pentenoate hydratase/2-oxohepta-3-ene-1,7-dioic acid hydratase in catechol pathway n=1 Tax=Microbacterium thalassium TaxID=362649 RepID=A0A7X0KU11_9MICO|nr:fumarylacetoacetate hydrolase family protein [Microbacterium thalassium]MBB6390690.1 2-keto-4-pentenoate hydratase/2-oxohepta-3-ene-1,7-dioic acid hydratase in catechol pathway [Microbacterium thalassium]GLK25799.1 hydrolase [Microbacterium thalassium]